MCRFIGDALGEDEGGRRMEALELYNRSLTLLRSGVASLRTTLEESLGTAELQQLKEKMNKLSLVHNMTLELT